MGIWEDILVYFKLCLLRPKVIQKEQELNSKYEILLEEDPRFLGVDWD